MSCSRRATHLNLYAAAHQVGDETLVRITGLNISLGIVGLIVQSGVAGICIKYRNDLGLDVSVSYILRNELEVENGCWEVSFES